MGKLTRHVAPNMFVTVKTTMDLNETVLRQAERRAQQEGKPLAAVVEDALRASLGTSAPPKPASLPDSPDVGLEEDDPFFRVLEDIRERGRLAARHRDTAIP